jgi:hypothetical protein
MEDKRIKALKDFKVYLLAEKDRVNEQIGSYPPPIPACDAQFNYLLDERTRISNELRFIDTTMARCSSGSIDIEEIEQLIASSARIDNKMIAKLRSVFNPNVS